MSSCGNWSITARATVRPPKPESKMPMGASVSMTTGDEFTVRTWSDNEGPNSEETIMTLDLGAPASVMARLCEGVRDDQLGDPTPCAETDVAGMLAHIIGFSVAFR